MKILLLAASPVAIATLAQPQSPSNTLPGQAASPSRTLSPTTSNAGTDEVVARRKLEESGYRDLRNMTPNADGTFSADGTRGAPGIRQGTGPEVKVDIDASGHVKER
ncbi:hypothetical protein BH11PSE3_BH11PSE3_48220 [soil metagenome]